MFLFVDNEMDGAAIAAGLASTPCASWLKEVIPLKAGLRLKVHGALKSLSLQGSNQVRIFIMYMVTDFLCSMHMVTEVLLHVSTAGVLCRALRFMSTSTVVLSNV